VGSIPLGKAAGIANAIRTAGRMAAANAAGTEAQSLVNNGQLADTGTVARDAVIGGAIPLGAAAVGRAIGAVTKNVSPEEVGRVARINADNGPKLKQAEKLINAGGALPPAELGDKSFKNW